MTTIGKNHLEQFYKTQEPAPAPAPADGTATTDDPAPAPAPANVDLPKEDEATKGDEAPKGDEGVIEPKSIDEQSVLEFLKQRSNGKEISSIDDLFKNEDPKDNPFDKYSESVKGFLKYHEETGRDYDDFKALNVDFTKKSALELAREKAISQTGGKLEPDEIDAYLEHKLNIDLSDEENIEKFDMIELDSYVKEFRDQKIKEQEQYLKPADKNNQDDFVTLDNGTIVPKQMYDDLGKKRQEYIDNLNKSSDNIKGYELKLTIDDNGENKTYELGYDYSQDDKRNMVSSALDIDKSIESLFATEQGFNHKDFAESFFWIDPKNREKAIGAIVNKALAKQAEDIMSHEYNARFTTPRMPQGGGGGKRVPIPGKASYGVKYDF